MSQPRALSLIKQGSVMLMNDWLARRWSVIIGQTTDLQQRNQQPWIDRPTPEFRLAIDGRILGLMDLDAVEWVEDCTPLGAEVVMQRQNSQLVIELRTFMFHHRPGLVRRCRILNKTDQPLLLDEAWTELVPTVPGAALCTLGLEAPVLAMDWLDAGRAIAVERHEDGFLLVTGPTGRCASIDEGQIVAAGAGAGVSLSSGAWVHLPTACLLPYTGDRKRVWETDMEPFLRHVQSIEEYDHERAAAALEPSENTADIRPPGAPGN